MINLIVSRSQKENSSYIEEMIYKLNKENKKVYQVVPQQFTLNTELRLFQYIGEESLFNIKVKSFTTLIREVLSTLGGIKKNSLSNSGKILNMKLALNNVSEDLVKYRKIINKEGFVEIILDQIDEFKDQEISPFDLREISKEEGGEFEKKLNEIALIYEEYERLVGEKFIDTQDKMEIMNELVSKMDSYRNITFIFDSFNFMNSLEIEFLYELQKITDIYIVLTLDPNLLTDDRLAHLNVKDYEVFRTTHFLYQKIKELDCPMNIKIIDEKIDVEKNHLLSNIFSYDVKKLNKKPENIKIQSFKNTYDEVLNLEMEINKKIQEGYRYKDIMVLITDEKEYEKILKRVFKNSIPFFIDEEREIRHLPFSKFVIATLEMLDSFNIDDIFVFLKSEFSNINEDDVNNLQIYINSRNIKGSMIFEDKYFLYDDSYYKNKEDYIREQIESANRARIKFIDLISDIYEKSRDIKKIKEHCKDFYDFLTKEEIIEALSNYEEKINEVDNEKFEEYKQIWNSLIDALDEVYEIAGEEVGDFSLFKDLYLAVISSIKISIIPPSRDKVVIGNLQRTRSIPSEFLYILGMSNTYIPRRHGGAEILNRREKRIFQEREYFFPSMNEFTQASEYLNLYNSIEKANKVSFSYARNSSDNQSMDKSYIIKQIESSFDIGEKHFKDFSSVDYLYSKSFLKIFVSESLSEKLSNKELENKREFASNILGYFKKNPNFNDEYESIMNGLNYTTKKENLSFDVAKKLYMDKNKLSSSELENFYTCPYQHFIKYGIKPDIEETSDVDLFEIGNILHNSLEYVGRNYYKYLSDKDNPNLLDELDKPYYKSVDKSVDIYKQKFDKNKHIIEMLKDKYNQMVLNILRQLEESDVVDVKSEVLFGEDKTLPGIELSYKDYNFIIEGKIDRVDFFELSDGDAVRVIDYKSGNKEFNIDLCLGGITIQLLVYLNSLKKFKKPIGAFYLPIAVEFYFNSDDKEINEVEMIEHYMMDGIATSDEEALISMDHSIKDYNLSFKNRNINLKGRKKKLEGKENLISDEYMEKLINKVEDLCIEAVKEIRNGNINTKPYRYKNISPCIYCDYQDFCGFNPELDSEYRFIKTKGYGALEEDNNGN